MINSLRAWPTDKYTEREKGEGGIKGGRKTWRKRERNHFTLKGKERKALKVKLMIGKQLKSNLLRRLGNDQKLKQLLSFQWPPPLSKMS